MRAASARSLITVTAIALTSLLFTTIFTIASSVLYSTEQSNFRQVGGYEHGGFKYLTKEQAEELKDDPLIREYGLRHMLGMAADDVFRKSQVEVSYKDAATARFNYNTPDVGRLPAEHTDEAAADTQVLSLLGVPAEIGTQFTVTIEADGVRTAQTFTLSGYWKADAAMPSYNILLPDSRVDEILAEIEPERLHISYETDAWFLDVMFADASHIEDDLNAVLQRHGYVAAERNGLGGRYISTGVNWGYLGAQFSGTADTSTVLSVAFLLLLIAAAGYLIIYNIFQISVSADIRFYGLLKTIGTTGRQLKRIVLLHALTLSAAGIPAGLLLGYGIGALLLPVILSETTLEHYDLSASPLIFVGASAFSLATVLLSCRRPRRMASKVSPVEAVRYTENTVSHGRRSRRAGRQGGASLAAMAWANLGRSRKKTAVTVLSLSFSVVLLTLTVTIVRGFDLETYVSSQIQTDFHVAEASYYQPGNLLSAIGAVPEDVIAMLNDRGGITDGGCTYTDESAGEGYGVTIVDDDPESFFRRNQSYQLAGITDEESRQTYLNIRQNEDGTYSTLTNSYGMEPFCLDQLTVLEGSLEPLYTDGHYAAAVVREDDYGNPMWKLRWAGVGDQVTLRYESPSRPAEDVTYEIAATVVIPTPLSKRYFGLPELVVNSEDYTSHLGTAAALYYVFDMEPDAVQDMDSFLAAYTSGAGADYDYESRLTAEKSFEDLRNTFLLAGAALSLIIGLIGVLNFLNTILTGINVRRREFAVLQSVGMTGRQLKRMLGLEGVFYAVAALALSFAVVVASAPLMSAFLDSMFWFFRYRFTITPAVALTPLLILLGVATPRVVYRLAMRRPIVERIRDAE